MKYLHSNWAVHFCFYILGCRSIIWHSGNYVQIGGIGKVTERILKDVFGIATCEEMLQKSSSLCGLFSRSSAGLIMIQSISLLPLNLTRTQPRKFNLDLSCIIWCSLCLRGFLQIWSTEVVTACVLNFPLDGFFCILTTYQLPFCCRLFPFRRSRAWWNRYSSI